eukprot:3630177-Rhodomonas_salina.1
MSRRELCLGWRRCLASAYSHGALKTVSADPPSCMSAHASEVQYLVCALPFLTWRTSKKTAAPSSCGTGSSTHRLNRIRAFSVGAGSAMSWRTTHPVQSAPGSAPNPVKGRDAQRCKSRALGQERAGFLGYGPRHPVMRKRVGPGGCREAGQRKGWRARRPGTSA